MNDWELTDNIQVALTTTKYVAFRPEIQKINCPVCVTEMNLSNLAFSPPDNERFELVLISAVKELLTKVNIDPKERTIKIGEDNELFVEYKAHPKGIKVFEDAFFSAWESRKVLMFETQIFKGEKLIIAINAIYFDSLKRWRYMKDSTESKYQILNTKNFQN